MSELASSAQLRGAFLRWALFLVPGVVLLGYLSSAVAGGGPGTAWFDELVLPDIYPPSGLFGMAWNVSYVLMGVAAAVIASARGAQGRKAALAAFAVQLVINLAWSPVFFGRHQITGALVLILVLDVAVAITIFLFRPIRPVAAWLMMPYLLWIAFATVLTGEFRAVNPDADGMPDSGAVTRIEF